MSECRISSVALSGFGAIGQEVAKRVLADAEAPRLIAVAVRSQAEEVRRVLPPDVQVVGGPAALVTLRPGLVVECAGQEALAAYAPELLAAGIDVMVASVGALARPGVLETWLPAGVPARLFVPAGAHCRARRARSTPTRGAEAGRLYLDQAATGLARHACRSCARPRSDG